MAILTHLAYIANVKKRVILNNKVTVCLYSGRSKTVNYYSTKSQFATKSRFANFSYIAKLPNIKNSELLNNKVTVCLYSRC